MSTRIAAIREALDKIWLNATSHGHGEPIASQVKAIREDLAALEADMKPQPTVEGIEHAIKECFDGDRLNLTKLRTRLTKYLEHNHSKK